MTYPQAVDAIMTLIEDRKLRPGTMLPSARLLTKQFECDRKTIHRACQDLISKGILVRTGYKLFVGAGNPSRPPVDGIVYVLSYWDEFLKFAGRILTKRGISHRTIALSHSKHMNPRPVLRTVFAQKPAGLILWMPTWKEGLESELEPEKIPMVICTDGVPTEVNLHVVGTDFYRSVEKALRHLKDLGHRHIAHVTLGVLGTDHVIASCYRTLCLELGLKSSASNIWQAGTNEEAAIGNLMREQHKKHPEVTALFATDICARFAKRIFRVPKELSVISLLYVGSTGVAIRGGDDTLALWACTNLISQIQTLEAGLPARTPFHASFMPQVIDRGTTRALTRLESGADAQAGNDLSGQRRSVSPWDSWKRIYPFLQKGLSHNWHKFDLSKLANHSMTREHGWLGESPLLHFSPGQRSVHGVPFQVIDENRNASRAVVTFRSPHTHSANGRELPIKVKLPVERPVKALYFLHGCGWANSLPFAEYIMHFKNGKAATVPLIPFGPSSQLALKHLGRLKPNIQDWWPLSEPQDFPHAMHAVVFNAADPMEYERYLYTLEWINPRPRDEVSHVEVRVDPKAGPTLALIAVTALL